MHALLITVAISLALAAANVLAQGAMRPKCEGACGVIQSIVPVSSRTRALAAGLRICRLEKRVEVPCVSLGNRRRLDNQHILVVNFGMLGEVIAAGHDGLVRQHPHHHA